MFSKAAYSIFMLRTSALISSLVSVALVASSHIQLFVFRYGFEDIVTFRYVMAVGVMSLVYGVVQLPFAASYALKHERLMPLHYEFYADQVMSVLLATGSGAGIAVASEMKKGFGGDNGSGRDDDYFMDTAEKVVENPAYNFFDKLLAASVCLFLAWLCLALVSIICYNDNNNNNNNTNPTLSTHHHHRQANTVELSLELSPREPAKHTQVPTDEDIRASPDDGSV